MIEKDQYVKCLLNHGVMVEGFVEIWSDQKAILKNSNKETIIINNTERDIICIKICHNYKTLPEGIEKEFQQVLDSPTENLDLKNKKLAELKIMMNRQKKEEIANKLKDHHINEVKEVKYGIPRFSKKPGT